MEEGVLPVTRFRIKARRRFGVTFETNAEHCPTQKDTIVFDKSHLVLFSTTAKKYELRANLS